MCPTTVSDLQEQKKLNFRRGDYNILDCGIRTGKTYWAINNLRQFTRDGHLNRIIFMVDTTALKDQLLTEYGDCCVEADDLWEQYPDTWVSDSPNKIGVMCYQRLGQKCLKNDLAWLDNIDVICWDECDSIFDFATKAFVQAKKTDYGRGSNAEILVAIQRHSTKKEYMPLVLLGQWERIVNEGRIMCIGLSASPERAYAYYKSLTAASYQGKLEANYRAAEDIYFYNLKEHCMKLAPIPGKGYWCYSPFITSNQALTRILNDGGFNAIEIHSPNNKDYPLTDEQKRVWDMIITTGMVPEEYDFVIVNKAMARGITITDTRFDNVIIDSFYQEDRIQAARQVFPYQRHLKVFAPAIPENYLNKWMTVAECRELAAQMAIPELDKMNSGKPMTWNRLKEYLPQLGYEIQQRRKMIKGKQQQAYFISGTWHDVEIADADFLQLVEAKQEMATALESENLL